jgi:hypothetical protein
MNMEIDINNTPPHSLVEFPGGTGVFLGPSRYSDDGNMCIVLSKGKILFINTENLTLADRHFTPPLRSEPRYNRK